MPHLHCVFGGQSGARQPAVITFIQGSLREFTTSPPRAIVVSAGIGYEVNLPVYVAETLRSNGTAADTEIEFEIYYHVTERQPRPYLVGFLSPDERRFFTQLIEVEGIGPSKAVAALAISPAEVAQAIETEDIATLTDLPGIGARAAQKMVATLKGKVAMSAASVPAGAPLKSLSESQSQAVDGLISLGYRPREARRAVEHAVESLSAADANVETLLREVFRTNAGAPNE